MIHNVIPDLAVHPENPIGGDSLGAFNILLLVISP